MNLSEERRRLKQEIAKTKENSNIFSTSQQAELYFLDMAKDTVDTVKPYKTPAHRTRDFLQIFYGIHNAVVGILQFVLGLLCAPIDAIYSIITFVNPPVPRTFRERSVVFLQSGLILGGSLLAPVIQTFRGITQIVTSPLTLIRIPLRDYLSRDTKPQYFEDRKSVKRLVQEADKIITENKSHSIEHITPVLDEIYRKKYSNINKNQNSYQDEYSSVVIVPRRTTDPRPSRSENPLANERNSDSSSETMAEAEYSRYSGNRNYNTRAYNPLYKKYSFDKNTTREAHYAFFIPRSRPPTVHQLMINEIKLIKNELEYLSALT